MDLRIDYTNTSGNIVHTEYETVIDFIDTMESDEIDIPMLDDTDVHAEFFNNKLNVKDFDTISDLLEHCKEIIK